MTIAVVPNLVTLLRIIGAVALLAVEPFSGPFFAIYLLCGGSDLADGFLARKLHASSKLGQVLDSIADAVLIGVLLLQCLPVLKLPKWALVWIAAIALLRGLSLGIGVGKYHAVAWLHTYANKAAGGLLFCFPLFYWRLGLPITMGLIGSVSTVSALEELIITLTSPRLQRDIPSIFQK